MTKRCFDGVVAVVLLLLALPLLLATALAVALALGRPVLFRQPRSGVDGKPFNLIKFRSMSDQRGDDGELLPDERRLGRFGRFLRASSIDELPTLLNVIGGDMSLVGPRPLFTEYLDKYSCEQRRRLDVKPGITGWAQINGRNNISWQEKFSLDVWYVDNRSFWLDLKILFLTGYKVLARKDVEKEGFVTTDKFEGNS